MQSVTAQERKSGSYTEQLGSHLCEAKERRGRKKKRRRRKGASAFFSLHFLTGCYHGAKATIEEEEETEARFLPPPV